jgi:deazaflavin-dependent oxidoreductase (nitroreductase family)
MSDRGIPRFDPLARRGPAYRAYTRFLRTRTGRWIGINVAAPIDPFLLRVSGGRVGAGLMLPSVNLTTTGAKSGQSRTATVLYFSDGDDVILIASSFGRDKHPAWYHNLSANPEAKLERSGRQGDYRAAEVDDDAERDRLFALADRVYGGYADYRERTARIGRRIPVMRLTLVSG